LASFHDAGLKNQADSSGLPLGGGFSAVAEQIINWVPFRFLQRQLHSDEVSQPFPITAIDERIFPQGERADVDPRRVLTASEGPGAGRFQGCMVLRNAAPGKSTREMAGKEQQHQQVRARQEREQSNNLSFSQESDIGHVFVRADLMSRKTIKYHRFFPVNGYRAASSLIAWAVVAPIIE
jgi:hypothetical protein